jgi:hypothetical protein
VSVRFPELVIDILAVNVPRYIFAGIEQLLCAEELCTVCRLQDVLMTPVNDLDRGHDGRRYILFARLFDSRSERTMAQVAVGRRIRIEEVHHPRSDSGRRLA